MASVWGSSKRSPPPNFVFCTQTVEFDHACEAYAIRCKRQRIGADPADPADPSELSDPADPVELSDPADPADPASLFDLLDKDVVSTIFEFLDIHEIASARLVDKTFLSATPPSWTYLKRCGHLSFERVCCALNSDEVDGKLDAGEVAFWEDRIGPNRFDALMRSQAVQSGNYVALVRFNAADRAADRAHRASSRAYRAKGTDRWLLEDSDSSADEYTDSSDSVAKYVSPRIFVSPLHLAAFARNPAAPLSFFVEKMDSLLLDSKTRGEFEILLDVSVSCLFEAVRAGREAEIVSFFSDIATDIVSDERKHCNVFHESDNVAILLSKCVAASAIRRSEVGKNAVIRIATAYRTFVMARAGGDDDSSHVRRKEAEQRILWERGLGFILSDFFHEKPTDPAQFDFLVSVLSSVFRLITMRDVFDAQKIGLLANPEFAAKLIRQEGWSNDGSDNWFGRVDEWFGTRCPNCLVNLASKTDALAAILQTVPSQWLTRKATCVSHDAFVRSPLHVRPTRILAETLFYAGIAHLRGALMMLPLSFHTRSSVLQFHSFALALLRLCCSDKYDYVIGRCNTAEKARLQKAMVDSASFKKAFLPTNRCRQEVDLQKRSRFLIRLLEETGLQRWEPLWAAHAAHAGYDTFISWAIGRQLHITDATKKTISTSDTLPVSFVMLLKRGYPLPSYVPCPRTGLEFDRVRALAKAGALHHLLHVNRLSLFFPEMIDIIEKTGPFQLGV